MNHSMYKTLIGCAALVAIFVSAEAKPKSAAAAASPPVSIGAIWNKLLSHCGDSYFYAGSAFDTQGMLSSIGAGQHPDVIEFKGVKFNTVPIRITEAERMNGIEYHARVSMIARVYRTNDDTWSDGPGMRARNTNDIIGLALKSVVGDSGQLGLGGAMAFDVLKIKGSWAIGRSSQDMSGPLTFGTKYFDVQKLIEFRTAKYQCSTKTVSLSAKEQAAVNAETADAQRRADEAERQKADAAAKQRADEARQAFDRTKQNADARERDPRMVPWRFQGTPEQFKAALLANLEKRAQQFGVEPDIYKTDINMIMQIVTTCTGITREDYEQALALDGEDRQSRLQECDGSSHDLRYWGTMITKHIAPRALSVSRSISSSDPSTGKIGRSDRFSIVVRFMGLMDDEKDNHKLRVKDIDSFYDIIDAEIPFADSSI